MILAPQTFDELVDNLFVGDSKENFGINRDFEKEGECSHPSPVLGHTFHRYSCIEIDDMKEHYNNKIALHMVALHYGTYDLFIDCYDNDDIYKFGTIFIPFDNEFGFSWQSLKEYYLSRKKVKEQSEEIKYNRFDLLDI